MCFAIYSYRFIMKEFSPPKVFFVIKSSGGGGVEPPPSSLTLYILTRTHTQKCFVTNSHINTKV